MQVTTTQLNHKTKRDDSVDLSRYFVLFIVLPPVQRWTYGGDWQARHRDRHGHRPQRDLV